MGSSSSWYKCQVVACLCLKVHSTHVLLFHPNILCEVGAICLQYSKKARKRRLIMNCHSHFWSLLIRFAIFPPLQDKFSGTHCFLKMSLIYSKCNLPQHSHRDKISCVFKCLKGDPKKEPLCTYTYRDKVIIELIN